MRTRLLFTTVAVAAIGTACSVDRLSFSEPPDGPKTPLSGPSFSPAVSPSVDTALSWTPPPAAPAPDPAPLDLPLVARAERDGVRLTIELVRNPFPAAEWTAARTRVTNIGRDDLTWFHDGCANPVSLGGELEGQRWRPGFAKFVGQLAEFQGRAVENATFDGRMRIGFIPERWIGQGSIGCADIGMADVVRPGASIETDLIWDGTAAGQLAPPPAGPVHLTGTFQYYWRGKQDPPGLDGMKQLSVSMDGWIEPGGIPFIHPAEAIDVALLDPRLAGVIADRDLWNGNEDVVRFDVKRGIWSVGLLEHHGDGHATVHLVEIDGATGARLGWIERPWDYDREGVP
jgi:hypothetical protein